MMNEIAKYIEQMKLKKAFFGFNRVDVYNKMMDLQNMFQCYSDQYDKTLEENKAVISKLTLQIQEEEERQIKSTEREKELRSQIESLQQKLDQKTNLEIAEESIQKANTNARLIIEQAKIDAEFESLKFRKKQRAEKEKYETWRQHTEAAGQDVLDHLKQVAEGITSLDDTLRGSMHAS